MVPSVPTARARRRRLGRSQGKEVARPSCAPPPGRPSRPAWPLDCPFCAGRRRARRRQPSWPPSPTRTPTTRPSRPVRPKAGGGRGGEARHGVSLRSELSSHEPGDCLAAGRARRHKGRTHVGRGLLDVLVGEPALAWEDDRRGGRGDLGRLVVALFWWGAAEGASERQQGGRVGTRAAPAGRAARTDPSQT